jgi:hypothetical protein
MLGLALPVCADLAAVVMVSDRTEARVRVPADGSATAALDLETAPELRLQLASPRMRYVLAYTPRATLWDVGAPAFAPTLLHAGAARIEWLARSSRLSLDQTAGYGGVNFSAGAQTPGSDGTLPDADVVPSSRVVDFAESSTTLASRLTFRRWITDLSVGYQLGGGATREARADLPFQQGPFAAASVTHALTRTDDLATTLSASQATYSSGPESILSEVDERWSHRWSRVTSTELALGVSEARVRASDQEARRRETYPVAEGVFERRFAAAGARAAFRASSRLGPAVNRLLGVVDQRVQGTLALTGARRRFSSHVYASGAQSVPATGPDAVRVIQAEVGAAQGTSDTITVDGGVRGLWQQQVRDSTNLWQATVFLGLTWRARPRKL